MYNRSKAVHLGITANLAFAAGCLLQALHRHSPNLDADILLYTDGLLPEADAALLRDLGATLISYTPPELALPPESIRVFSHMCLAKLEGFRLLERYETVIWLDVDTAIQGDIGALTTYGPYALALEDPHFTEAGVTSSASINVSQPCEGLNGDKPNYNSGIMVLQKSLGDAQHLYHSALVWAERHAPYLKYPDQAVCNMLLQQCEREAPSSFTTLPYAIFNAHPRNPAAQRAAIVHAFGAYKLWDDGLTRCSFPEWERDYFRWLAKGGTPWQGAVDNEAFLDGGAFFMLTRLFTAASSAETMLDTLQEELAKERLLRARLEKIIATHTR